MSRLAAPKSWKIKKKENKWIAKSNPGPHTVENSVTVSLILKELLKYAKTTKEVKKILNDKLFFVDSKVVRDYKFSVGIMDYVEIPSLKEKYQVLFGKDGKIFLSPVKNTELKLLRVQGKTLLKKGKIQLNFFGGRNIIADKFDGRTGDTVVFDLKNKKIVKVLKLGKGSLVYLMGGKNKGSLGEVKVVMDFKGLDHSKIVCNVDGKDNETLKSFAYVVDKELIAI